MLTMKSSTSGLARDGLYLVAASDGNLRALVDENLVGWMPDIRRVVADVAAALNKDLPSGVAVSVRFERAPGGEAPRLPASAARRRGPLRAEKR